MRTFNIRSVLAVLFTAMCTGATGQTATQNYVKAETTIDTSGGKVTSVEYYDGLGRPVLTVANGHGTSNYVYERRRYDYGDRISEQYIKAYGNTQPLYKDSAALNWLYSSDPYKSTHTTYDGLGRQTVVKGPGKLWHDNSRYVTTAYGLNAASEVRLYKVSGNSLTLSGYYAAGMLNVEQVKDENNHVTKVYKDMQDRVVLECRNGSYYTYYVYDYLGNLRYVLPPLAADALTATSTTWSSDTAAIKRYGYYYEYDSRNRCTKKQLPGCDYVTMTYDTCDRLTGSQDGNQRQSNTSTYYEYDNLGRQKVMGTKDASGTKTPLIETFYDDYSFLTTAESNKVGFHTSNGYESSKAGAKGLQTGSRVHQLDSPSTYTVTAMYYNSYGEMIQSRSTNHRSGNDDLYIKYNHMTGQELNKKHIHSASSQTTHTEIYSYEYNAGQLKTVKHKLDNNAEKVLYTLTYDNYGRVSNKSVMGNKESIAFQYNIRDWLANIGSTRFTEQIAYNATNGNAVPSTACYNGNIAAISWKAGSETAFRTAKFTYNNLDWLTGSTYSGTGKYTTSYTYDKMGNIKTIKRNGLQDGSTYGLIDNLTFTYTGNQVTKIEDAVNDPTYNGAFNFNDGVSQSGEYAYDKNGNLTKDLNKKISSIKYNFLNLPSSITYSTGKSATYIYDASGMKLRTSYKASSSATAQPTDYCGNMIYENNVQKQILIDGGYITFNGSTPVYHYYLQDHQGNNRVVCNASGTVEQVNHYYPFGGLYGQSTNGDTQRFKYNGKELDRMHGLDLYDYEARHYDAAIGRFTTVDPMAEKYYNISPYAYCANNPVNRIDPDGMDWYSSLDSVGCENGQTIWQTQIHYTNCTSQEQLAQNNINGNYLGETIVLFDGYYDEELGIDKTLDGPGSKHATATVYGSKGPDDITKYTAFTMTSDFDKYGAIQDGIYNGSWRASNGKGTIPKHYMLENGGAINTIDGNRYEEGYSKDQKNGIFIHRTNNSGTASGRVSIGCLLIKAQQMVSFEKHVGRNPFKVILRRK